MKEIMAKYSSSSEQGVPSFEYGPATERQPLLFELSRPLDALAAMLLTDFAGQRLTMNQIYEQHHIDKRYVKRNYKDILLQLEAQGKIVVHPLAEKRPKREGKLTFGDKVQVTFPKKS